MIKPIEQYPGLQQTVDPNIEALLAQGFSQYDSEMMLANGIDPSQLALEQTYASPGNYNQPLDIAEPSELQRAAQDALVTASTNALSNAANSEKGTTTAFWAAEEADKDVHVKQARHDVEVLFGGQATGVEKAAMSEAIELSPLASTNKDKIAEASANGRSPLAALQTEIRGKDIVDNFAELKDKVNGRAEQTVHDLAENTKKDLERFGFRNTSTKDLGDGLLRTAGADLTKVEVATAAKDTTIGEEAVRSVTDGKPKMTNQLREKIMKMAKKGQLKALYEAVSNKSRSRETLRKVGKQLNYATSKEQK